MAINIFDTDLSTIDQSSDISLESQIKYALEAFNASLKVRGVNQYLKGFTDETVIYGINKTSKEPVTIVLEDETDLTDVLPILMYFAVSKSKEPLLPTSDIHMLKRFVTDVSVEDLSYFILELESLKYLLFEEDKLEEDDQLINISIYPQLSKFMLDYKQLRVYLHDDKHISNQHVKDVIKFIYNTIIQMNIKGIYKGNIDNSDIDFSKLNESQKVDYVSTNYHFETLPIESKLEE